jgi:hypothetical protein
MAIDWRRLRPGGGSAAAPSPRARVAPQAGASPAPVRVPSPRAAPASRPPGPRLLPLVRRPAEITLAVTLLRLAGEKLDGAPELFDRVAGGGLAWVGIVWLVPLVGFFFGWKLQRRGLVPPDWRRAACLPAAALLLPFVVAWIAARAHAPTWSSKLAVWGVASAVACVVAALAWPALGRLLVVYAFLARLPVVVVMAAAIRFEWGTHYDALPPGVPVYATLLERWLWLGLLPQLTIWVAFTVGVGALCGLAGWHAAKYREA